MIGIKLSIEILIIYLSMVFLVSCANKTTVDKKDEKNNDEQNHSNYDVVEYLGHGSLKLYLTNGKVCYIDPYAGDDYKENADLILITHEHMDHTKIDLITQNPDCQIIRSADCIIDGEKMEYKTFDICGIHIEPVQAYNSNHKVSECVGYVISSNGKKIYIAGDTSKTLQMEKLANYAIDYAFLPIDGRYNMDIDEAIECEKIIKAKHTIPYHMSPGETFNEERAKKFQTPTSLIVHVNEKIEIK